MSNRAVYQDVRSYYVLSRPNGKNIRIMTTQVSLSDEVSNVSLVVKCRLNLIDTSIDVGQDGSKSHNKAVRMHASHLSESSAYGEISLCHGGSPFCSERKMGGIIGDDEDFSTQVVSPFRLVRWTYQELAESDYALNDSVSEKKYGFKLSDALDRAKANGGKLFAGKTFYVTSRVPVEFKLLKNVVSAGGGHVRIQSLTLIYSLINIETGCTTDAYRAYLTGE